MKNGKTLEVIATILGNIAAISAGIGIYEHRTDAALIALLFAAMAVITIGRHDG